MTDVDFSSTQLAILILLRAPDRYNKINSDIPGNLHLIKELFAIWSTPLGKELLSDLNFEPDNFGPYDETINLALKNLQDAGYVNVSKKGKANQISITAKGRDIAETFSQRIKEEILTLFKYTKVNYNHLNSEILLDRIYSAYPEYTTNSISKIAEKYKSEA